MDDFKCEVVTVEILPHDGSDFLELAKVGDYLSVVQKGKHQTGDKVVYIPEQSELPDSLVQELGLEGKLSGSKKNRVKAIKLRGVLSQGLVYPAKDEWEVGQDVKEELSVVKWKPSIPTHLRGEVNSSSFSFSFSPHNIKKYPDVIKEGEEVFYTEKIHGTFCIATLMKKEDRKEDMVNGKFKVSSKGLISKGIYFKDTPENENNTYLSTLKRNDIFSKMEMLGHDDSTNISLVGEVYGKVQDLKYGVNETTDFRAFGIHIEGRGFLNMAVFLSICKSLDIPTVPVLYAGLHSKEKLLEYTSGREQVSGKETNLREGIVIYPIIEREDPRLGRVFFKSISEKYLLRKGGTEYN